VIDAHHHFWGSPNPVDHPWMTDELAAIRRPFGPDDLRPLLEAGGVASTVLVQTRSSLAESRELLATAERCGFVAGVVAWVDLTAPDVARQISELRAGRGGDRLVGVRHQVHDEADPHWLLRDDVLAGLDAVARAGLVYDLLVREPQLPAALDCARRLPHLALVLDHIAKPRIAAGPADQSWAAAMAPFADLGNVACKVSGMVTEADWRSWRRSDLAPYVERVAGWFGDDRLVFGSDWPVCLLAADYGTVLATARELLASRPPEALDAIFGGNAARIYGLTKLS
jgi:L-fuconolactonase